MENKYYLNTFCNNIVNLRKIFRLSKREMAKKLRIGVKSLTMIESGQVPKRLSVEVLFWVHENFGITPGEICTNDVCEMIKGILNDIGWQDKLLI